MSYKPLAKPIDASFYMLKHFSIFSVFSSSLFTEVQKWVYILLFQLQVYYWLYIGKGMILYLYLSRSFPMSWLFISGDPSIDASVTATILPMNNQGWFPLGLTCLIFLQSQESSNSTTIGKNQFFGAQHFLCSNSHMPIWLLEKP